MNQCLKKDPKERPDFYEIIDILKIIIRSEKEGGNLSLLFDMVNNKLQYSFVKK